MHKTLSRPISTLTQALPDWVPGLALFLSPGALLAVYAAYLGGGDLRDGSSRLVTQLSAGYLQPDLGGPNVAAVDADISVLDGGRPLFEPLFEWYLQEGGVYKLAFGPKAFLIVSDPVIARHILKEEANSFSKGVLAEILEAIMGNGLIPADLETWKVRRRAIVPAFHKAYLNAMIKMFGTCTQTTIDKLDKAIAGEQVGGLLGSKDGKPVLDMETEFLNVALDIIGLGVFNYDFGSVTRESPVIKAVYGVLREAEYRSTFYIPYWNIPGADLVVPRLRDFKERMGIISGALDELIDRAKADRTEEDFEALQARDYENIQDPSLLRFLVDSRGEDITNKQLRDDLMTMLIAGHETTAAVLTWVTFSLAQNPDVLAKLQAEVDAVLGYRTPSLEDIKNLTGAGMQAVALTPAQEKTMADAMQPAVKKEFLKAAGADGEKLLALIEKL